MDDTQGSILLICGTEHPLESLITLFNQHHFHFDIVNNKDEAFIHLLEHPDMYSVVILDQYFLSSDQDFCSKIQLSTSLKLLSIIILTESEDLNFIKKALLSGAQFCLPLNKIEEYGLIVINQAIHNNRKYNLNVNKLNQDLELSNSVIHSLESANFKFRTLEEASNLANFLAKACPNPRMAVVGLSEIFINAIEHGNLNISYQEKTLLKKQLNWQEEIEKRLLTPENKNKYIEVTFKKNKTEIIIEVTDQGAGFDWQSYQEFKPEKILDIHGRGILLAKSISFSELTYNAKGNQVHCVISPT
ncbi:MAG: response regulator with CheY-like receiver, AAA-type ATPase, and DNA-binding domain [Francisellaceae bacterium]|nr:response regulator with CheY-like receiver, AAA-type ATPase, and DNA-binding domain [Francisellaceae bacterium]